MELNEMNISEAKKWLYRAVEKGNHAAQEIIYEFKLDELRDEELDPRVCNDHY